MKQATVEIIQDRLQWAHSSTTESGILNVAQREIFQIINISCISFLISLFGIAANIINITIFIKQGFTNTVNIGFLGLGISDLCCLMTLVWIALCQNPLVLRTGVPWVTMEFEYLTGAWPHIVCGRITSYITVYITAERCLCILLPLKVKQILTPTRTTLVVCIIYIFNILTLVPEYLTSYLEWRFFPELNKTLIAIAYTSHRESLSGIVYFVNSVSGVTSFLAVSLFTSVLVFRLNQTSKWRKTATSTHDKTRSLSTRDKKTVQMVVSIAVVLIVCYTPGTVFTMTTFVVPDFSMQKRYVNLGMAMWSLGFVFQSVNSSVNIFLFYKMSSNFRDTFHELFNKLHFH